MLRLKKLNCLISFKLNLKICENWQYAIFEGEVWQQTRIDFREMYGVHKVLNTFQNFIAKKLK